MAKAQVPTLSQQSFSNTFADSAPAIEFARTSPENLKLVLTARRIDTLKQIADEIKNEVGEGVEVLPVKLDISNPEEVRGFVGKLPEGFREIDILVNNA